MAAVTSCENALYMAFNMNSHNDHLPGGLLELNWQSTAPLSQRAGFESCSILKFSGFPFVTAQVTLINNCDDQH